MMIWSFCLPTVLVCSSYLVCASYSARYDIAFNPKKHVIVIVTTKEDDKVNFPSFHLATKYWMWGTTYKTWVIS